MLIQFRVPGVPIAQPRQRHTRTGMNYTPTKHPVNAFKAAVALSARMAFDGAPLEGPIRLSAVIVLPRAKGLIWKTKPMPRLRHTHAPDADNILKSLTDALTGLVWRDDGQVCDVASEKWIASGDEQPHVEVVVEEIQ